MQDLGPHPSPSESELLRWDLGVCVLIGTAGYSNAGSSSSLSTLDRRGQRPPASNRSPEMCFHSLSRPIGRAALALPFPGIRTILSFSKGTRSRQGLVAMWGAMGMGAALRARKLSAHLDWPAGIPPLRKEVNLGKLLRKDEVEAFCLCRENIVPALEKHKTKENKKLIPFCIAGSDREFRSLREMEVLVPTDSSP